MVVLAVHLSRRSYVKVSFPNSDIHSPLTKHTGVFYYILISIANLINGIFYLQWVCLSLRVSSLPIPLLQASPGNLCHQHPSKRYAGPSSGLSSCRFVYLQVAYSCWNKCHRSLISASEDRRRLRFQKGPVLGLSLRNPSLRILHSLPPITALNQMHMERTGVVMPEQSTRT